MTFPWNVLGLAKDGATIRDVRSAYARILKEMRPEDSAEESQLLVEARDLALCLLQSSNNLQPVGGVPALPTAGSAVVNPPASAPLLAEGSELRAAPVDELMQNGADDPASRRVAHGLAASAAAYEISEIDSTRRVLGELQLMFSSAVRPGKISAEALIQSLPLWNELLLNLDALPLNWRGSFENSVSKLLADVLKRVPIVEQGSDEGRPLDHEFCRIVVGLDQDFGWDRGNRGLYAALHSIYAADRMIEQLNAVREPRPHAPAVEIRTVGAVRTGRPKPGFLWRARWIVIPILTTLLSAICRSLPNF